MSTTCLQLINQAFEDLGVIQPGETLSTTYTDPAFDQLNQILLSLAAEGLTNPLRDMSTFSLVASTVAYTVGPGGTFSIATRPLQILAWKAYYGGVLTTGGKVLTIAEFDAQAKDGMGTYTSVPQIVGADTNYPLLNLRVFPTPSALPGTIELTSVLPLTEFASTASVIALPPGWVWMLRKLLAVALFPQYARQGQSIEVIAAQAQEAKKVLVQLNAPAQVAA